MPRHQVLRRLAKHFPVIWVEPAQNWRQYLLPFGSHFLSGDRWSEPTRSLEVLKPGWPHPRFHRSRRLDRASFRSRLSLARRRLLGHGAQRVGLYIWRDEFADALDLVQHDFSCYHVDDEYSFSDREQPTSARETALLERVDQVIVHSPALMEKKGRVNPRTALIPNGVNYRQFAATHEEPSDMVGIPRPRIGYAGVVKKQLDIGMLVRLARARPLYSFVSVGPVMNVSGKESELAELKMLPNVYLLGHKPADALASYMHHFDVCMMCYEVNDYTRYIYPLKLNEYLASGRPTVSSPIETVRSFADVVTIADGDAEWLTAIDSSLADSARSPAARDARRAVARGNDWDIVVDHIAELFRRGCDR